MNTATIEECQNKGNKLINNINDITLMITLPKHFLLLYFRTIELFYLSKQMIHFLKTNIEECSKNCPSAQECLKYFCECSIKIRNNYINLYQKIQCLPFCWLQSLIFKHLLDEWDDLVEDLAIASDSEINNLIAKIANAA